VDELIAIGEFSAMCQLSVKMLRHYHDVGLLEPARVDPLTGYRYYHSDQAPVAVSIRELRRIGMPVGEIRMLLRARDPDEAQAILRRHREQLASQLSDAENRLALIEQLLGKEYTMTDDITEVDLPRQRVATKRVEGPQAMTVPLVTAAFVELHADLHSQHVEVVGPPMQIVHYSDEERFEHEALCPDRIRSDGEPTCRSAGTRGRTGRSRPLHGFSGSGITHRSHGHGVATWTRPRPTHAIPGHAAGHAAALHDPGCSGR
jgi:DNA-binding transcriptional MerR regulator